MSCALCSNVFRILTNIYLDYLGLQTPALHKLEGCRGPIPAFLSWMLHISYDLAVPGAALSPCFLGHVCIQE